jgi:hypothetical protein
MYTAAELVELGRAYMAKTGMSAWRLSLVSAGHNRLFERLFEGYNCRTDVAEKASRYFDEHWPDDLEWPKSVSRTFPPRVKPKRTA